MKYKHSEKIHNEVAPKVILPLIFDWVKPISVLDVGCGIGTWLSVCKELGVTNVIGIDSEFVDRTLLFKYLPEKDFFAKNLNTNFNLDRKFDLVICLEVAEHLEKNSSEILVKNLVNHGDVILFSAAIPGQGGQNHLNEQWPNFWEKLFNKMGYEMIDFVRPKIWDIEEIEFWYKQNIFIVVKKGIELPSKKPNSILSRIHPELLELKNQQLNSLDEKLKSVLNSEESLMFYLSLLKKKLKKIIAK